MEEILKRLAEIKEHPGLSAPKIHENMGWLITQLEASLKREEKVRETLELILDISTESKAITDGMNIAEIQVHAKEALQAMDEVK